MVHQLRETRSISLVRLSCGNHSRFSASSAETGRPACAYPINRRTIPNPAGVSSPRFSLSAICQIYIGLPVSARFWNPVLNVPTSPRTSEGSRVFSKNLTATSPVTTPIFSESAAENNWPNRRRSSGLKWRLGCSRIERESASTDLACILDLEALHTLHLALLRLHVSHVCGDVFQSNAASGCERSAPREKLRHCIYSH